MRRPTGRGIRRPWAGTVLTLEGMPTYTVDIEMHGRGSNMRG